jgi:hypothetical protein
VTKMNGIPSLRSIRHRLAEAGNSTDFWLSMDFPVDVHEQRGAPQSAEALITVPHASSKSSPFTAVIEYTLQWRNKTACHAPEVLWFSNAPSASQPSGWVIDKMGSWLNPLVRCKLAAPMVASTVPHMHKLPCHYSGS